MKFDVDTILQERLRFYFPSHKRVTVSKLKDPCGKLRREADDKEKWGRAVEEQIRRGSPPVSDKDRPRRGRIVADDLRTLALLIEAPEPTSAWHSGPLFYDEPCEHGRIRPYIWRGEDEESSEPDFLPRVCEECKREAEEEQRRMAAGIFD